MPVAVWSESPDVPGHICSDARLAGGKSPPIEYPEGSPHGQAGWDFGIRFKNLKDLAGQLTDLKKSKGPFRRLAIHAHGQMDGVVFIEGEKREKDALNPTNLDQYQNDLKTIGECTEPGATILFMGCIAGLGFGGTQLITKLSKLWSGRSVVAFTTIGYVHPSDMVREWADNCTEPGMRDTGNSSPSFSEVQDRIYKSIWKDLKKLPWQSEKSPSAKVAFQGAMIKGAVDEGGEPKSMPWQHDVKLAAAWNDYLKCKAFNYMSSCSNEYGAFLRMLNATDRGQIKYTGAYGPKQDQPPWRADLQKLIDELHEQAEKAKQGKKKASRHR